MGAPVGNRNGQRAWFKPGQVGNPRGSRRAGETIREALNHLADRTEAETRSVADDPDASVARRAAARLWLEALQEPRHPNPIAALDQIMDRTVGKPKQVVETSGDLKVKSYGIDPKRIGAGDELDTL